MRARDTQLTATCEMAASVKKVTGESIVPAHTRDQEKRLAILEELK